MKQKRSVKILSRIYLFVVMVFLYTPIIYLCVFSFNNSKSLTKWSGFSTQWYERLFSDATIGESVYYTILVAVLATLISTIIGTITAIGLSKSNKILKEVITEINNLPMMNPDIVTAIGLMLLFASFRLEKGLTTMLIAHITFCTPYVILNVMPKLRGLDPNITEAAMDLGAKPHQALIKVVVPQIAPGIISGALIAFTMSIDDFVISYFVTGNGVKNISILVYSMSKRLNPTINALSTIMVLIVTVVLILINVIPAISDKRKEKKANNIKEEGII